MNKVAIGQPDRPHLFQVSVKIQRKAAPKLAPKPIKSISVMVLLLIQARCQLKAA